MARSHSKGKLLFCTGEGIGNVIQTIPVIRTLKEVLGFEIDLWHAFGSFPIPKVIPYVDKWFRGVEINNVDFSSYKGIVSTRWTKDYIGRIPLPLLNNITPFSMTRSEVDTYMDIARDLGAKDFIWHGRCEQSYALDKYDIVMHNGYNPHGSANWKIKSYPYYSEVAEMLKENGYSVCSVGYKSEYIEGTEDKTGLDLLASLGVIANSKVFIGNDSGLYHCANALSVPNVVIFTASSTEKNYDPRFHKYATIIGRTDLKCRPCQAGRKWKDCKTWECRELNIDYVVYIIGDVYNGN
jgi:ADP-heptose:LPS heptosyltransferase